MSLKYEIRPRNDKRGVDLVSPALPFGRLWYREPNAVENAASYAQFNAGSQPAVISIVDESGLIVDTRNYTPAGRPRRQHAGSIMNAAVRRHRTFVVIRWRAAGPPLPAKAIGCRL